MEDPERTKNISPSGLSIYLSVTWPQVLEQLERACTTPSSICIDLIPWSSLLDISHKVLYDLLNHYQHSTIAQASHTGSSYEPLAYTLNEMRVQTTLPIYHRPRSCSKPAHSNSAFFFKISLFLVHDFLQRRHLAS